MVILYNFLTFLMSVNKIIGRDHRWVTSHRFPIQLLCCIFAATPKEASEKLRSVMLRPVPKNAKRNGNLCLMTLCQLKSLSNEAHFKKVIVLEEKIHWKILFLQLNSAILPSLGDLFQNISFIHSSSFQFRKTHKLHYHPFSSF